MTSLPLPEEDTKLHGNCVRCLKEFIHHDITIPTGIKGFCTAELLDKDVCAIYFEKAVTEGPAAQWGIFHYADRDHFEVIPPDPEILQQLMIVHQQAKERMEAEAAKKSKDPP